MIGTFVVEKEEVRKPEDTEYVQLALRETGEAAMHQYLQYNLREDEMHHKGKLVGKTITLYFEGSRGVFGFFLSATGKILTVK